MADLVMRPNKDVVSQQGRRVLIVEDDPLIAEDFAQALRREGCEVVGPARTLAEAIEMVRDANFDAAVLDINLGTEKVHPAADLLIEKHRLFAFATADYSTLPRRLQRYPVIVKPYTRLGIKALIEVLFDQKATRISTKHSD